MWSTLTNLTPATVNRWISVRFNMLSSAIVSLTAVVMLLNHRVDAAAAGFALAFITSLTSDLLFLVRRFVALEQAMVAVERVKEFSELQQEPPEYVEPRPPASWPVRLSRYPWLVVRLRILFRLLAPSRSKILLFAMLSVYIKLKCTIY